MSGGLYIEAIDAIAAAEARGIAKGLEMAAQVCCDKSNQWTTEARTYSDDDEINDCLCQAGAAAECAIGIRALPLPQAARDGETT